MSKALTIELLTETNNKEKNLSAEDWHNTLLTLSKETGVSVETILEFIEMLDEDEEELRKYVGSETDDEEYLEQLMSQIREWESMLENCEDPEYGCDPYPEY